MSLLGMGELLKMSCFTALQALFKLLASLALGEQRSRCFLCTRLGLMGLSLGLLREQPAVAPGLDLPGQCRRQQHEHQTQPQP